MSERLSSVIDEVRRRGEGVFMPFLVTGDPDADATVSLVDTLFDAGADIVELGFPFSDPPADGPVIQAADDRALRAGMTPARAFDTVARIHERHAQPHATGTAPSRMRGVGRFGRRAGPAVVLSVCPTR